MRVANHPNHRLTPASLLTLMTLDHGDFTVTRVILTCHHSSPCLPLVHGCEGISINSSILSSIHLSMNHPSLYASIYSSISTFVPLPLIYPSIHPSRASNHQSISPSIDTSIHLAIGLISSLSGWCMSLYQGCLNASLRLGLWSECCPQTGTVR